MLDVRRLRALRELADRGTIAAAADALHLTPSAVSQQLSALEAEVGRPLLVRSGRAVRLTPAAGVVLHHADAMLAETERLGAALHALTGGAGGVVRVGTFATGIAGLVLPALGDPDLVAAGVRIEVTECEAPEVFALLSRHELDVALSFTSRHAPPEQDRRLTRVPLHADRLHVALPAGHPLEDAPELDLALLADEEWVAPPAGWSCEHVVTAACEAAGFVQRIGHRSADWHAVLAMVGAGLGASLVPTLAAPENEAGVRLVPLRPPAPARHLFAACRRGGEDDPAVRVLLDALRRVSAAAAA